MLYFQAVCIQAMVGVLWVVLLFDAEQGQVEVLKHTEQTCTSQWVILEKIHTPQWMANWKFSQEGGGG